MLWILLSVVAVRGVIYAVLNPYAGSPDELDHLEYVAYLATGGASGPRGAEGHQPVPYYALLVPFYWLTQDQPHSTQMLAVRLASIPLLVGQVLFAWLAARKLAPGRPVAAVVAAGFVALHPQLAYIGASANNDNAANFMAALLVYLIISLLVDRRWWLAPVTGLALVAATQTKGQILPVVALLSLVLLVHLVWHALSTRSWWALSSLLPLAVAAAFVASLREAQIMAERALALLVMLQRFPEAMGASADYVVLKIPYQFTSFWAAFLGEAVQPDGWWYLLPVGVVAAGLVGHGAWLVRGTSGRWSLDRKAVLIRVLLLALVVAEYAMTILIFARNFSAQYIDPWALQSSQGRYLFPVMVPLALLVADGWGRMVQQRRWAGVATLALLVVLALFDLAAMSALLEYYQWPPDRLPSDQG
jgi:hypothetical protein